MTGEPAGHAPLILTARLDAGSFARLEAERRALFPPARNLIPAHLTLFHHLPGAALEEISGRLSALARGTPPLPMHLTGLRFLGRGVAYVAEAPALARLRGQLAVAWQDWLGPQDRQGWRPHVTVQNKATPEEARATLALLQAAFAPRTGRVEGLLLWHYRGGPWEAAGDFPFAG